MGCHQDRCRSTGRSCRSGAHLNSASHFSRAKHNINRSGNPMQNGFIECFIGRLRDECFNEHLFNNLPHAGSLIP
ncbi:integrase core domain-containing protein [Pseudovibrio sp. SPO723]|uniref:integrase core domain-containing protein n=1 Tax=Nesiotobacter zosterae TaxID=392721 RepID=UPI0039B57A48